MSIARGTGQDGARAFDTLTGGYGGALGIFQGIRYKAKYLNQHPNKIYEISQAFGSHGSLYVSIDGSTFTGNRAWRDGGGIYGLAGKSVAKDSDFKVSINTSTFDSNKALQGNGGGMLFTKGKENGDYYCTNDNAVCDTQHFAVQVENTVFGTNTAGKANANNDIVGDETISDESNAWRHVNNFKAKCDSDCCEAAVGTATCTLEQGENARCQLWPADNNGKTSTSYSCNDGLFLMGTATTHRCTIQAKSVTSCPKGYEYDQLCVTGQ